MSSLHKKNKARFKKVRQLQRVPSWTPSWFPSAIQAVRNHPEKMSELLENLVDPYMSEADSDEARHWLLSMGVIAWNVALNPPGERVAIIKEMAAMLPPEERSLFCERVNELVQRRLDLYPDNRRLILSFNLTNGPTGPYLQVVSSLPL